ncbi:MAG TPA: hypothetical protein VLN59_03560, partial [Burkholderiales bacterium]|nr:hypothetical protein [Burkholderiales bacterium]
MSERVTVAVSSASFVRRVERVRSGGTSWLRATCYATSIVLLLGAWQALGNRFGMLFVPFTTTLARLWEMLYDGPL